MPAIVRMSRGTSIAGVSICAVSRIPSKTPSVPRLFEVRSVVSESEKGESPMCRGQLLSFAFLLGIAVAPVAAEDNETVHSGIYAWEKDIPYRAGDHLSEYARARCRLDLYYPTDLKNFATVVWFHGGGLKNGEKDVPGGLRKKGLAVVAVNYRLSPKVKSPTYIEDAAAAVAWTFHNINQYGGSPKRIFVSGHSAGGYLTSMVGLDQRWLKSHGIGANDIAGLIPYSGHTITHFTVRAERGIDGKQPVVDEMAPLFHVRKDAPPLLLITGDRNQEMLGRYEETAYLWRMMQEVGHPNTELFELEGYNHGEMAEPAHPLLIKFVKSMTHLQ